MKFIFALLFATLSLVSCEEKKEVGKEFETVTAKYPDGKNYKSQVYSIEDSSKVAAREYYDNGTVKVEMKYQNGLRNGPTYSYYKNGKPWSLNTFQNDSLHGAYQTWHENGQLYYDGQYDRNRRSGVWKFYNESGAMVKTIDYEAQPDTSEDHLNIPKL
ncbi:MAG: hypothetical protein SGI87_07045 [Flavobacteriales bacterium]|nr:hypothetical protein [Flavobacteriales bacterium]